MNGVQIPTWVLGGLDLSDLVCICMVMRETLFSGDNSMVVATIV